MSTSEDAWFRPKSIGFGWEPASWQGWVVTIVYVAAVFSCCALMLPTHTPSRFFLAIFILTAVLWVTIAVKGEKKD